MLKESSIIVIIHVICLMVGLYVTVYFAAAASPVEYAVFALYQIVTTMMSAFSFLGYETNMMRNVLSWLRDSNISAISQSASKAVVGRIIMSMLIFLPAAIYLLGVLPDQYKSNSWSVCLGFTVAGLAVSLIQASTLILKSQNLYMRAILISAVGLLFIRVCAVIAYESVGFSGFIMVLIFASIFLAVAALAFVSRWLRIEYMLNFRFKDLFTHKEFSVSAYLQYVSGYFDRLLVSIFAPPEILGSYNLAKQVQEAGKSMVEGFVDPITQRVVAFKSRPSEVWGYYRKVFKIQAILFMIACVGAFGVWLTLDTVLSLSGLNDYPFLNEYISLAVVCLIFMLASKVRVNFNSYFLSAKRYFFMHLFVSAFSLIFVAAVLAYLPIEMAYGGRLLIEFLVLVVNVVLFRRLIDEKIINRYV